MTVFESFAPPALVAHVITPDVTLGGYPFLVPLCCWAPHKADGYDDDVTFGRSIILGPYRTFEERDAAGPQSRDTPIIEPRKMFEQLRDHLKCPACREWLHA